MIAALQSRLEDRVEDLAGRTDGAAEFAALMASGKMPGRGVQAFVLPLGITGRRAEALTGVVTQDIERSLGVVILTRSVDAAGERALARLDPLVDEIIEALLGWAPSDETGVLVLRRANIIPAGRGLLGYQIEFTIQDQLRIPA